VFFVDVKLTVFVGTAAENARKYRPRSGILVTLDGGPAESRPARLDGRPPEAEPPEQR